MSELAIENSLPQAPVWVGIDVAKAGFEAAMHPPLQPGAPPDLAALPVRSFVRTREGVEQLVAWIDEALGPPAPEQPQPEVRVLMEATGNYSLELATWVLAARAELRPAIVNPGFIAAHARSLGLRNKTDRADARVIARFGAERSPQPFEPLTPEQAQLRELMRERHSVLTERVAMTQRAGEGSCSPLVRRIHKKRIAHLVKIEEQLKAAIEELLDSVPQFKADLDLLTSIPGVGLITAATVLGELGDLRRFTRARALSAFVGLSPRQRQSGSSVHGRTRMSKKGNPRVRSMLYMATLAAVRGDHALGRSYRHLVAQGKSKMAALGAVMRKLLVLMRALIVSNSPYRDDFNTGGKLPHKKASSCTIFS